MSKIPAKIELRRTMRAMRNAMSAANVAAKSTQISERLLQLTELRSPRSVFTYVSYGNEVQTHDLICHWLQKQVTVCVPFVVRPGHMELRMIRNMEELTPGALDIPTAASAPQYTGPINVSIVPGVAFTTDGCRLGQGGGFYDRFLASGRTAISIALGYDCQIIEQLTTTDSDRPVNVIVTETRVIRVS